MAHRGQKLGVVGEPRVVRVEALRVGEDDQHPGADEVGDDRGEAVVVAQLQLVDHHRVVLVHDGDHTDRQHALQSLAGVEVLAAIGQDVSGEEDLAGNAPGHPELPEIPLHEPALAHRCGHLQPGDVARPLGETEGRQTGRDRTG